jgi:hypothetical protein
VCVNTCHTEGITFAASEQARSIIHVLASAFGLRKTDLFGSQMATTGIQSYGESSDGRIERHFSLPNG